jgi:quinol monooxygenase YgiN
MLIALGDVFAQIPRREEVRALMRETQAQAREQPGCIDFVFAETLDDPGHFVIVQQWRDRAALEQHYRSRAFADYQAKIGDYIVRSSALQLHAVDASAQPVDAEPILLSEED